MFASGYGERQGTRPRHSKHKMHRKTQHLSAVDVCEANGVCNDGLRHEWHMRSWIRLDTSLSTTVEHLSDHSSLLLDFAFSQRLHARD